jgi:hypothetical protein
LRGIARPRTVYRDAFRLELQLAHQALLAQAPGVQDNEVRPGRDQQVGFLPLRDLRDRVRRAAGMGGPYLLQLSGIRQQAKPVRRARRPAD